MDFKRAQSSTLNCAKQAHPRALGFLAGCALMLLAACGSASVGRPLAVGNCKKSPTVTTSQGGSGQTTSLNLASSGDVTSGDVAIGTGYIDISTKDANGKAVGRRCTMSIRPLDATSTSNTIVRIWTAGHCAYDPQTPEFKNAKYSLQIYYKGGYFNVPAKIEGFAEFAKFAQAVENFLGVLPSNYQEQIFSAFPQSNTKPCLADESALRAKIGSRAKNIACFTRGEMRGLKTELTLDATTTPYVADIMSSLRARENAVMTKFDATFKKLVQVYLASHHSEVRRKADLRSFALSLNQKYCDAASAAVAAGNGNVALAGGTLAVDASKTCAIRGVGIPALQAAMPAEDFALIQSIADDTTSTLDSLVSKSRGCNNMSASAVTVSTNIDALTPCDFGNIQDEFWRKWVDPGNSVISSSSYSNTSVFGLYPDSYFSFSTNSFPSPEARSQNSGGKAKLYALNSGTVLDFGLKLSSFSTFLINYDSAKHQINPVQGDSGSILSIFGVIPAGLLSTVDGKATSGGASVTPLPQVGSEEEETSKSISGRGC